LKEGAKMIVDIHCHVGESKFGDRPFTVEMVLKIMDECGIDKAILLPAQSTGRPTPADKMAEAVRKAPDRLVFFAAVDPKLKDATTTLEQAVVKYGAKGLKIHPSINAIAADDKLWIYPLIEKAQELKIPVMIHSGESPYATPWQVGLVAMDFPKVTIIMEHMGCNSFIYTDPAIDMARRASNLILGTTGVVHDHPIAKACQVIGSDRVVFGSDAPVNNPLHEIKKIQVAKISEEDKRKILGENIARILGLWGY
jgi:predicted TIM-barrel fold metal-dependent hydrolase